MSKKYKIITAFLVVTMVGFFLFNAFKPRRAVSAAENRELADFPKLSAETLEDGSFMSGFEEYASDQFMFRDSLMAVKANIERLIGKKENNGVYFADDGYLVSAPRPYDESVVDANNGALKSLSDTGKFNVTLSVVPTAFNTLGFRLPSGVTSGDYWNMRVKLWSMSDNTNVNLADPTDELARHNSEDIYYRTDHHQTSLGSYYLYRCLAPFLGYTPYNIEDFNVETVTEDFYGTCYSKAPVITEPDKIEKYTLKNPFKYTVEFPGEDLVLDGLYNEEKLKERDKYAYFLDGNHPLTVIKSSCGTGRNLAVIKDSYAHSLAPFLANHFDNIYMFDLRYYNDDIVKTMRDNNIDTVLALFNSDTYVEDGNLSKLSYYAENSDSLKAPPFGLLNETKPVGDDYFADAYLFGDSLIDGLGVSMRAPCNLITKTSTSTLKVRTDPANNGEGTLFDQLLSAENVGKVYTLLGLNEIGFHKPEDYIAEYRGLIREIKAAHPNAVVYVNSMLPVAQSVADREQVTLERINNYNGALRKMCEEEGCYYLDIYSLFAMENGFLPEDAASDGVHLDTAHNYVWEDYLKCHAVQTGLAPAAQTAPSVFTDSAKAEELAAKIVSGAAFPSEMSPMNGSMTAKLYNIAAGEAKGGSAYTAGGAVADELAVFETDTPEQAEELREKLTARVESKKRDFENYIPEEMPKLNEPVIIVKDNFAALCVGGADAADIINEALK